MCRTIIAFGILAIDIVLPGEDQMTASGTLFKAEVPMTHLDLGGLSSELRKKGRGDGEMRTWASSAEVGAVVGGRGQRGFG
jgi:hypothetical protein